MAANGISTLSTKEKRQLAKLDLAQAKRKGHGITSASVTADTFNLTHDSAGDTSAPYYRTLNTYDVNDLPTKYSGDTVVDNANVGGLQAGRPWS